MNVNKVAVRHWLDRLGQPGETEPNAAPVICHDPSGTTVLGSSAEERRLRQLMEPKMVGPVEREYSMLADGDLVALLGLARLPGGQTSQWV